MKSILYILTICFTFCSFTSKAQTPYDVEQQIKSYMERIEYWKFKYEPEDTSFGYEVDRYDSLSYINDELYDYLRDVCGTMPQLMSYNMNIEDMKIVTSNDKKLRTYSWERYERDDNHHYDAIMQLITEHGSYGHANQYVGDKKVSRFYEDIYTIKTKDGKTIYLLKSKSIHSNNLMQKAITSYVLTQEKKDPIVRVNAFQKDKTTLSFIDYYYDYLSNYSFEDTKEEFDIHLSKNNKKLYIPLVDGDMMTGDWLVYVFNGYKFVYSKKAK